MPVVRINDATFADLKSIATWFGTKTPSDTIDQIVHEAMQQLGIERDNELGGTILTTSGGAMQFDNAPSLAFTKPVSAVVNGKAIPNPRWSTILLTVIAHVKAKVGGSDKLLRELHIPTKPKQYEKEGFKYHPNLGISIQGQSAADAWKEVDRLAKKWGILVQVEFLWRQNSKAQYPGRTGLLRSGNP